MAKRLLIVLGLVLPGLVGGLPTLVQASDSQAERATLAGLTAISVVVEDLGPAATSNGVQGGDLQKELERRVRQSGITITPDADAYLYVQITVADAGASLPLSYFVSVSLMQEVTLPRGLHTRTPLQSPTWWLNTLGVVSRDGLSRAVASRTQEFVDRFVKAYQSVNPKP